VLPDLWEGYGRAVAQSPPAAVPGGKAAGGVRSVMSGPMTPVDYQARAEDQAMGKNRAKHGVLTAAESHRGGLAQAETTAISTVIALRCVAERFRVTPPHSGDLSTA